MNIDEIQELLDLGLNRVVKHANLALWAPGVATVVNLGFQSQKCELLSS